MTDKLIKSMRESAAMRWLVLTIVAVSMLTLYLFQEIISPLKPMLEKAYGWSSSDFGLVTGAYGWLNVFLLMLVLVGILLDKIGVRISAIFAMFIAFSGALIKWYAFKYIDPSLELGIFGLKTQVAIAGLGFSIFGVGTEYAGITVSKIIVKWFKGKEMALAMGMEMAFARLGSFLALLFAPIIVAKLSIPGNVLLGTGLLLFGMLLFIIYFFFDVKIDKQEGYSKATLTDDEKFQLSDIKLIITNKGFWYIALLCVLFYSAVFPFYKFGPDLMVNKFGIAESKAGQIPSLIPLFTILLTPVFGFFYDKKGKGASIMYLGAALIIIAHLILWVPTFNTIGFALVAIAFLGIAFSLVPSAMWASVPKIIPEKQLGTAFALIFWIQNWGLMGIPTLLGKVLDKTNPETVQKIDEARKEFAAMGLTNEQIADKMAEFKIAENISWDYSKTWLIFIVLTILSLLLAFLLKREDRIKGYGLEKPNIVQKTEEKPE
ncbi:MAG: MFS transporter [Bacteroidales bacterium]|nr:MFS transporter [Bacteroidales bacterium]